jgi:hypothetical protein
LLMSLSVGWQWIVAAIAVGLVFALRRSPFHVLILAGAAGALFVQLGATLPTS